MGAFTGFGVVDLTPNKVSINEVDITNLNSLAKKSQASKTPDFGEVALTMPWSSGLIGTVNGWITGATTMYFKLTIDDSGSSDSAFVFPGWVKEFEPVSGTMKKGRG